MIIAAASQSSGNIQKDVANHNGARLKHNPWSSHMG